MPSSPRRKSSSGGGSHKSSGGSSHKSSSGRSSKSAGASTKSPASSNGSTRSGKSSRSSRSHESKSTPPTSPSSSRRESQVKVPESRQATVEEAYNEEYYEEPASYEEDCRREDSYREDLSPATNCYARSSQLTYASTTASEQEADLADSMDSSIDYASYEDIQLPMYRREVVEDNVRPSTPKEFASLFPSMNRLSIRHDDFTSDGNVNLRVDTVVPGSRKRRMMQLFHLRMYDLAKREFSLRRYCRDSGREVCNSKRKYDEPAPEARPKLQRSVTSAIKTLSGARPGFRRASSNASPSAGRPATSHSYDGDDEFARAFGRKVSADGGGGGKKMRATPTNAIKLEFSNYARVDVERRGSKHSKRYDFAWWGHKYSWKRVTEKHLGVVSYHLLRDGKDKPIAHIVPETRSPNQERADESAGHWIPPCYMWISDKKSVKAVTDVADVIVATGLMTLVDDSIRERWENKNMYHIPVPLTSKRVPFEYSGPKAFVQQLFTRRNSTDAPPSSPLRYAGRADAY